MAAASRAHQHDADYPYVLTAPTGCRASCNLPHPHLPCQPTRDRHGHQHYSAHAPRYLTYSGGTTQRSRRLGHHIREAFSTTACHRLATLWSMKTMASTDSPDSYPTIVAAPCSSRKYSIRIGSMRMRTSMSNHPGLPAQIVFPTSASTPCVQMDRSGTSHPASEEEDHRLPQHGVPQARKTRRPC